MKFLALFGYLFGVFGFIFGLRAFLKVRKLEAELKRRNILDENFRSEP